MYFSERYSLHNNDMSISDTLLNIEPVNLANLVLGHELNEHNYSKLRKRTNNLTRLLPAKSIIHYHTFSMIHSFKKPPT